MSTYRVAIIGAGRTKESGKRSGYGTAHNHIAGYIASPDCEVVAVADIVEESATAFAEMYAIPNTYTDYNEMMRTEKPDIVSICTWTTLHHQMVLDCAKTGVNAIHCEKPMAPTWGEAKEMVQACEKAGCQLTFNHQNRFDARWNTAKRILDEGVIGELRRIEGHWGNMLDVGTHWLDLFNMYNNETPADWVLAQMHRDGDPDGFGVKVESSALVHVHYTNDVYGFLAMGDGHTIWAEHRLLGTEGMIEVDWPEVRVWGKDDSEPRILDGEASENPVTDAILDVVEALKTGRESAISAAKAIRATEVIFAGYESSRRRGRVDLPLDVDDNALVSMIETGEI
jgi:UDP-N-acetylglucosamine 3-dehydrogenase